MALYQHNRNPFVERPEWALAVFGDPLSLTLDRAGGTITLSWPDKLVRFAVECSGDLAGWDELLASEEGDRPASVSLPVGARMFFRIRLRW